MKNVIKSVKSKKLKVESVLIPLGLRAAASAADVGIH